jgi:hypothetical protein
MVQNVKRLNAIKQMKGVYILYITFAGDPVERGPGVIAGLRDGEASSTKLVLEAAKNYLVDRMFGELLGEEMLKIAFWLRL